MSANSPLHLARRQKRDEFYTQLSDIEKELHHYKEHFRGKVVYCNCDDPYESNFFKYFAANFNALGLKRLVATGYVDSPIQGELLPLSDIKGLKNNGVRPYRTDIIQVKDFDGDGAVGLSDVEYLLRNDSYPVSYLTDTGDFRSEESIEILKQADIVVTNPPFSMFREYVGQLMEHAKQFVIIGNMNAVTYKEIFPLIKENKVWLGPSITSGDREFGIPAHYPLNAATSRIDEAGNKFIRVKGVRWFTNLDHAKRHEDLILYRKYTPSEYPKYDNYDAINVDRVQDIPDNYFEAIGVPITFLDKYNPEQFEIISADDIRLNEAVPLKAHGLIKDKDGSIDGKPKYVRVVIRRRTN